MPVAINPIKQKQTRKINSDLIQGNARYEGMETKNNSKMLVSQVNSTNPCTSFHNEAGPTSDPHALKNYNKKG